jgi:hypothetical protein
MFGGEQGAGRMVLRSEPISHYGYCESGKLVVS